MSKKPSNEKKRAHNKEQTSKERAAKILRKALEKLQHDWEDLFLHKQLIQDEQFLSEFAEDIIDLEEDLMEFDTLGELSPTSSTLHKILEADKEYGFTKVSLLDAAVAFKYQDPLQSDLCHLLTEATHYSSEYDDETATILWALSQNIKEEK